MTISDNDTLSMELRDRTSRIEAEIIRRAEQTGTSFRFSLSPEHDPSLREKNSDNFGELLGAMATVLLTPREDVVVARREGTWQMRYMRVEPGASTWSKDQPLRDASLDVRRKFLDEFPRFIKQFQAAVDARVAPISATIEKADEALRLLEQTSAIRSSVPELSSGQSTRLTTQALKTFARSEPTSSSRRVLPENLVAFATPPTAGTDATTKKRNRRS